jgi:hypothetical protein
MPADIRRRRGELALQVQPVDDAARDDLKASFPRTAG